MLIGRKGVPEQLQQDQGHVAVIYWWCACRNDRGHELDYNSVNKFMVSCQDASGLRVRYP